MNRPLLSLKTKAPEQPSGATVSELPLPPRPPKREGPLDQLLTFIVVDRKPYHHATYAEADQERNYLQAAHNRRRLRKGHWPKEFRVMKVLNLSGAELAGRVVIHADGINETALAQAMASYQAALNLDEVESTDEDPLAEESNALRAAILTYLDAVR